MMYKVKIYICPPITLRLENKVGLIFRYYGVGDYSITGSSKVHV